MTLKTVFGLALIAIGSALAIFFWELHFAWFQGGPIGLVLVALGLIDLWGARPRKGGDRRPGFLAELRDDIVGPPRERQGREESHGPADHGP